VSALRPPHFPSRAMRPSNEREERLRSAPSAAGHHVLGVFATSRQPAGVSISVTGRRSSSTLG